MPDLDGREHFEAMLNRDPEAWGVRLVYADWLEDHGEPVLARGQRWQAENGKYPDWFAYGAAGWFNRAAYSNGEFDEPEDLPGDVFDRLPDSEFGQPYPCWRVYGSRRRAEALLAEALKGD